MALCHKPPAQKSDLPEAKQLCLCLLPKSWLRFKTKVIVIQSLPTASCKVNTTSDHSSTPSRLVRQRVATQKWWAAFMGDRAFARARAAGKNEIEASHARTRAGADIALSLPAEYRD